ncbi:MAG: hypothetical protein BGN86_12240, partial [Caulobacterales bacterium 68-7]
MLGGGTGLLAGLALSTVGAVLAGVGLRRLSEAEQIIATMDDREAASHLDRVRGLAAHLTVALRRSTHVHPVTGLPTREPLAEAIDADAKAQQGARMLGAIRFVDFDRLSAFDARQANAALAQFAGRLAAATSGAHLLGQIDRDCFCVWFRGAADLEAANSELRAMAYVAAQDLDAGGRVMTPTVEIGAAVAAGGEDAAGLFARVLVSLRRRREGGARESLVVSAALSEDARERFMLEQHLTQAISEDQLTMVFQPLVDLAAGRVLGAEALLRWDHPELGKVSPARFVPVIEAMGLSERYGLWVLNTACREARRWRDLGLASLKVSVNVSAKQLADPGLRVKIERTLQRHGLQPYALELELTETAAMADAERTREVFRELRAMGVSLAIDDFGAGYSSLSYLKNLPFDKLKIDREFVTDVHERADSAAICKALIELARGLRLQVLAEGVESQQELAALQALGCSIFQGYHISRPLEPDEFIAFARRGVASARVRRDAPL